MYPVDFERLREHVGPWHGPVTDDEMRRVERASHEAEILYIGARACFDYARMNLTRVRPDFVAEMEGRDYGTWRQWMDRWVDVCSAAESWELDPEPLA